MDDEDCECIVIDGDAPVSSETIAIDRVASAMAEGKQEEEPVIAADDEPSGTPPVVAAQDTGESRPETSTRGDEEDKTFESKEEVDPSLVAGCYGEDEAETESDEWTTDVRIQRETAPKSTDSSSRHERAMQVLSKTAHKYHNLCSDVSKLDPDIVIRRDPLSPLTEVQDICQLLAKMTITQHEWLVGRLLNGVSSSQLKLVRQLMVPFATGLSRRTKYDREHLWRSVIRRESTPIVFRWFIVCFLARFVEDVSRLKWQFFRVLHY